MKNTGKKIKIMLIAVLLFGISFKTANAMWLPDIPAMSYKQMLENIQYTINGSILISLKQMLSEQLKDKVDEATQNNTIDNPYEWIFTNAEKSAYLSTNSFIDSMTGGRTSDYIPGGEGVVLGSSWGGSGNYVTSLKEDAKKYIKGGTPKTDILNYVSDPKQMFSTGNWRATTALADNEANLMYGTRLLTENVQISNLSKYTELNKTLYQTGEGFAPVVNNGRIVTPGSVLRSMQSDVNDVPNQIVANATYVGELASSIVMSLGNRLIGKTIGGIGNIKNIGNQSFNSSQNYSKELERLKVTNPLTQFKPSY